MFDDLKAQLARVEARLRKLIADMQARIGAVENDVRAIDEPIQHAFDRADASIARVQEALRDKAAATKKQIGRLAPPGT